MADDDLDHLFSQAREGRDTLPAELSARILQDARSVQAEHALAQTVSKPVVRTGLWQQLGEVLGGWKGMGGLATACAAGVWIGLAPPAFLPDPVELVLQQQLETDLFPETGLGVILTEEG